MKKTIAMLLAGMLTVSCGMGAVSAAGEESFQEEMSSDTFTVATWTQTYQSVDEMMDNSDANVVGTVISQSVEARGNEDILYFTHSYVKGNDDQIYDVVQTGAVIDGKERNIPYDVSLLEVGEDYFLSLDYVNDVEYGNYYMIAGGTQGMGIYSDSQNMVYSTKVNERTLFGTMQIELQSSNISIENIDYAVTPQSDPVTDPNVVYWEDQYDFVYYMPAYVSSQYGSNIYNQLCDGAENWNGLSGASISRLTVAVPSRADIIYDVGEFGSNIWIGLTNYNGRWEGNFFKLNSVRIDINLSNDPGSYNYFWEAISCHEMGHALGLSHIGNSSEIMYSGLYNYLLNYPAEGFCTPKSGDITKLREKYGY